MGSGTHSLRSLSHSCSVLLSLPAQSFSFPTLSVFHSLGINLSLPAPSVFHSLHTFTPCAVFLTPVQSFFHSLHSQSCTLCIVNLSLPTQSFSFPALAVFHSLGINLSLPTRSFFQSLHRQSCTLCIVNLSLPAQSFSIPAQSLFHSLRGLVPFCF